MKNFLNYLTDVQKVYEFRIKLANVDPADKTAVLENALDSYGLESLSSAKRLPIKENDIDFPSMQNCQIYLMDAVLKYPVNDAQLRAIVSERTGIPQSQIVVVPKNHPEEQRRWDLPGNDVKEYAQGEAVLDKPLPEATEEQKAAGKTYSEAGSILKELKPVKIEIAGTETADGKTLNDIPAGTTSPIKGK
jgi:hypothetical protein